MDLRAEDHAMEDVDIHMDSGGFPQPPPQPAHQAHNIQYPVIPSNGVLTEMDRLYAQMRAAVANTPQQAPPFRDISVKVHIRRPEKDTWAYMGRGIVTQEISGQSSRVVVRSASSHKIFTVFGEGAALQAERRGNFVVIGCVDGGRVVSWSLNALNNSETVRLLASIELACYACKQAISDPGSHGAFRRRVARVIKDDRRRRHKRRKDQDSMIDAFARAGIEEGIEQDSPTESTQPRVDPSPPTEPIPIPAPAPMAMPVPEPAQPPNAPGPIFTGFGIPEAQ